MVLKDTYLLDIDKSFSYFIKPQTNIRCSPMQFYLFGFRTAYTHNTTSHAVPISYIDKYS